MSQQIRQSGIMRRMALLHGVLIVGTVLTVGWWITHRFTEALIREKWEQLSLATRNVTEQLEFETDQLCLTAQTLSRSTAVRGLLRARGAGRVDPVDGSTEAELLDRIRQTFASMIDISPSLYSVRLLDVEDQGMELVRVERRAGRVHVAPQDDLHRKADRDYVRDALKHAAPGQVHLSELQLNREHGALTSPQTSVLRAVTPVFDERRRVVFLLSVNLDCRQMFNRFGASVPGREELYLVDQAGRLLLHHDPATPDTEDDAADRAFAADLPALTRPSPRAGASAHRQWIDTPQGRRALTLQWINVRNRRFGVILTAPYELIVEAAVTTRRQALAFVCLAMLVALAVAHRYGSRLLEPLRQIVGAVEMFGLGVADVKLPTDAPHEAGVLARSFDGMITQVRQRSEALRQANKTLALKNRELEQFAYIASHDLQEPLRKIRAFSEMIGDRYTSALDDQGRDYLKRMIGASERMSRLINDLLTFSRISSRPGVCETVDLNVVMRHVLSDLEMRIVQCGATVSVDELPAIQADRTQMYQLFQNLLSNALKYVRPDDPPVVTVAAESLIDPEHGPMCRIAITDNGIGMDMKYTDRIFAPFQRLHGPGEYEGTGIGLAVCRKIVDQHHGTIEVDSAPGCGARFIITLPRRRRETDQRSLAA